MPKRRTLIFIKRFKNRHRPTNWELKAFAKIDSGGLVRNIDIYRREQC